jgi:hypothetical protein
MSEHLRSAIAIRAATVLIRAAITAIHLARVARHPVWYARYALARRHPIPGPGRDDGEKLTLEEAEALGNLAAGRDVRTRT